MSMYCYQCEQVAKGTACEQVGTCGKSAEVAALEDLLIHAVKGISMYAHRAARLGRRDREIDAFVVQALFTTVTNVQFDPEPLHRSLLRAAVLRDRAQDLYAAAAARAGIAVETLAGPALWQPHHDLGGLVGQGHAVGIQRRLAVVGADITGLQELILYGLKGAAAYADHARVLGHEDPAVSARFHEVLDFLVAERPTVDELVARALAVGELNLRVMELLDAANTGAYGTPVPTRVRTTPVKGKCILVSGHDLKDLDLILTATAGTGINVYTHSEMLPSHAYPGLHRHPHLVGNFGGAWQDQRREFKQFPGVFYFTTNCIQKPDPAYLDRVFTGGLVGWPGVKHIGPDRDFAPLIAAAQAAPGFLADASPEHITVGFGHGALLGVADRVIAAVKAGAIRRFFLVGGCDGAKPGRNYYTELAEKIPADCVILTLACGKYRFNKLDFGEIGGIPRLLDLGQCNDAYGAIRVATALAGAFGCGVNDLPLSLILSWFEQKAVAILLTLLHLGIRGIRIGPSLPAFISPAVLDVLVEKYDLKPITSPDEDLKDILGG
jgi:hydroxylamine reductase